MNKHYNRSTVQHKHNAHTPYIIHLSLSHSHTHTHTHNRHTQYAYSYIRSLSVSLSLSRTHITSHTIPLHNMPLVIYAVSLFRALSHAHTYFAFGCFSIFSSLIDSSACQQKQ